ncbi:MAG: hypothetical protein H0X71_11280 [Rubrobacter sp.]|nr:hypothetical protein [Rubrobacter sp.]
MDKKDERAEERKRNNGLTDEELKEKERLMRSGELVLKRGTGKIPEKFWKLPKPKDPEGWARRYLIEDRREGR